MRGLPSHNIVTVQEMGWAGIKNGELLNLVVDEFDIFITSDKNLRHQQNLEALKLTVILLPSNQVPVVQALLPKLDKTLSAIDTESFIEL